MPLSGQQIAAVAQAISAAFTRDQLNNIVQECLNHSLEFYVAATSYETQAPELVGALERRELLPKLLAYAHSQNPDHSGLTAVYELYCPHPQVAEAAEGSQLSAPPTHSPFPRRWPLAPPALKGLTGAVNGGLERELRRRNFFPFDSAESPSEVSLLFGQRQLFWRKHPVFAELEQEDHACIVIGAPGAGKTAWTWALGRYLSPPRVFACRFQSAPGALGDIGEVLALELIGFLHANPYELMHLESPDDHHTLARVLLAAGDGNLVLGKLGGARSSSTGPASASFTQEAEWRREEGRQLAQLRAAIRSSSGQPLSGRQWLRGFLHCIQRLEFEKVRLVFDDPVEGWNSEAEKVRHEYESLVQENLFSIQTILVTQNRAQVALQGNELPEHSLNWSSQDAGSDFLQDMIFYRAGQFGIPPADVLAVAGRMDVLLTRANGNPGRWARLWNHLLTRCRQQPAFALEDILEADQTIL